MAYISICECGCGCDKYHSDEGGSLCKDCKGGVCDADEAYEQYQNVGAPVSGLEDDDDDEDADYEDCWSCGASYSLSFTTDKTDCHRCGVRLLCPDGVRPLVDPETKELPREIADELAEGDRLVRQYREEGERLIRQNRELAMEHLGGTAEQRAHLPGCATTYRHEDDPPVRCDCKQ